MKLAHLDLESAEHTKKPLFVFNYKPQNNVAPFLYAADCQRVIRDSLISHERKIQWLSSGIVKRQQNSPVMPLVGRVQMHISAAREWRLTPF